MSRGGFDKFITVFSPEGHLYQVQYAFKAVSYPGLTTVAIRAKDGVVVATQHQVPDRLMRSETITSLFSVTKTIGCCVTGRAPDGKALVMEARQEAYDYKYKYGQEVPVNVLAKRMADKAQVKTQEAGLRPMGVSLTLVGMDLQDDGQLVPQIYKIDPAGSYVGFFGAATGAKEVEAIAFLEKKQKQTPFHQLTTDEASSLCLAALQAITGTSLRADDVELGRCTADQPSFERIPNSVVENWLTALAESDN